MSANQEFMFFEMAGAFHDFHMARLHGKEGVSQLFEFEAELACEDSNITFDDVVGKGCVISIDGLIEGNDDIRYIHGIVSHFEIADQGAKYTTYHAVIVPKIWALHHRHNSRIFTGTVQDIVELLLKEVGMEASEYRWDCSSSYPDYEYCVQYRESELNFLSRLLEKEGIYYYFEHSDERHVVVFCDDSTTAPGIETEERIPCNDMVQGMAGPAHIKQFRFSQSLTPGKVTLKDYHFERPNLRLLGEQSFERDSNRELYDYPGEFAEPDRAKTLANIRLQASTTYQKKGSGSGNVHLFVPGYQFGLEESRREQLSNNYLLTYVEHHAVQAQVYGNDANTEGSQYNNTFVCIPVATPFRPLLNARIPVVEGAQTAIVTGPQGEEIYTDEHGRVKVQFHWDRQGQGDEKSSCWIRVSQLWAGQGYGGFSLPRIGQEVIVDFIEGSPDRPVVTGRVHHGDNRTPYKLPDKKTVSTLKSQSTPGGAGFNEMRFEDAKGEEQLFMHAERNMDTRVKHDAFQWVGRNRHEVVINNRYTEIKNNDHTIIRADSNNKVEGDVNNMFDANIHQHTKGDENFQVDGERKTLIGGAEHLTVNGDINLDAGSGYSLKAGQKANIKTGRTINLQAGMEINIKAGSSFISIGPSGVTISGAMVKINSGGSAGSASPVKPAEPEAPEEALQALVADTAQAGGKEPGALKGKPVKPDTYGPQAKAMKAAYQNGTAFCEQCKNK